MTRIMTKTTFFASFCLIAMVVNGQVEKCPKKEDLRPCTCSVAKSGGLKLHCSSGSSIKAQLSVLDKMFPNETRVEEITINDKEAFYLRKNLFRNLKVSKALFSLPKLKSVHLDVFKGQEDSLKLVNFDMTSMSSIPTRILRFLNNIQKFVFYNSKQVEVVAEDSFEGFSGVTSLTEVSFPKNSIKWLKKGAFAHLVNLEELNLQKNYLSSIEVNTLPSKFGNPVKIDLSFNEFRSIPRELVKILPVSSTLNLKQNAIQTDEFTRKTVRTALINHLKLNLQENRIVCSCAFMVIALDNMNSANKLITGRCYGDKSRVSFDQLKFEHIPSCMVETEDFEALILRNSVW